MKTLSKVVTFHKLKDLCKLNKYSGDDTLNPVIRARTPPSVEIL